MTLAAASAALALPAAQADLVESVLGQPDFSFSYGGFIRNENAVSITGKENPYNQRGNIFNGKTVERNGRSLLVPLLSFNDEVVRPVEKSDTTFNMEMIRGEFNANVSLFSNLRLNVKVRAVGDPDIYDDQFDIDDIRTADAVGTLNNDDPNFYEYRYDSGKALAPTTRNPSEPQDRGNDAFEARQVAKLEGEEGSSPLEWAGDDYMVDLPQFYLDYQKGPLLIRAGNQQIAWGDLLFFRIMDVPNGLDLRRHQLLDFVSEEFSDKRIPSLGVRASYLLPRNSLPFNILGGWEIDSYAQRFRPTIYPNPNTPYNVIPSQFTVHDQFKQYDDEYNYGIRLRGPVGPVDLTLMANRRYNHFGFFQWTDSDVVQGLQPGGPAGVGDAGALFSDFFAGELADSVFEVDPTGVTSAEEFYTYGALARLNHFTGLNTAIREFPGAQDATAREASTPAEQEAQEDLFLQLSGGLRGHIKREYARENNFGLGMSYRIEGPSDSILFDQINASLEAKFTPDRKFTPTDLNPYRDNVIEEDEYEIGLVFQKFVRYSRTFPAAFAVLQYLHRSESDIFNRHLSGYGGDPNADDPEDRLPDGISSANYVAFAFQQPFPNRIWRIDFAALYDVQGGLLVQPALRWKPNSEWTFQVFANMIGTVHGSKYDNTLSTVDFADEITTRVEYQF
ncbi:hypothetical protein PC39_15529 [Salinisphaera sp. PC39]